MRSSHRITSDLLAIKYHMADDQIYIASRIGPHLQTPVELYNQIEALELDPVAHNLFSLSAICPKS